MIASSTIIFSHSRLTNTMDAKGVFTVGEKQQLGDLPEMGIKSIVINKQAQKIYMAYENQKSYYIPTGMVGPQVKLVCSCIYNKSQSLLTDTSNETQTGLYSNDNLTVSSFNFPIWNATLAVNSKWWLDNVSFGTISTGGIKNGVLLYDIELNLYRKD